MFYLPLLALVLFFILTFPLFDMRSSDVCCIFYVFIFQLLFALILVVVIQLFHFMVGMNVRSECIWHHEALLVQLALTFTIKSCNSLLRPSLLESVGGF